MKAEAAMKASADRVEEITNRAVLLIPRETKKFLENAESFRNRLLLASREFSLLFSKAGIEDALKSSMVRALASEIINKAGVKSFFRTPIYNKIKLSVRAEIIKYIESNSEVRRRFEKAAERRQFGFFARVKKHFFRRGR